jgi:hypothetical protein
MINTIVGAEAVGAGAGAASRYGSGPGSGSDQMMQLLAAPAPAPQHWLVHTAMQLSSLTNNKGMLRMYCSLEPLKDIVPFSNTYNL